MHGVQVASKVDQIDSVWTFYLFELLSQLWRFGHSSSIILPVCARHFRSSVFSSRYITGQKSVDWK